MCVKPPKYSIATFTIPLVVIGNIPPTAYLYSSNAGAQSASPPSVYCTLPGVRVRLRMRCEAAMPHHVAGNGRTSLPEKQWLLWKNHAAIGAHVGDVALAAKHLHHIWNVWPYPLDDTNENANYQTKLCADKPNSGWVKNKKKSCKWTQGNAWVNESYKYIDIAPLWGL